MSTYRTHFSQVNSSRIHNLECEIASKQMDNIAFLFLTPQQPIRQVNGKTP